MFQLWPSSGFFPPIHLERAAIFGLFRNECLLGRRDTIFRGSEFYFSATEKARQNGSSVRAVCMAGWMDGWVKSYVEACSGLEKLIT